MTKQCFMDNMNHLITVYDYDMPKPMAKAYWEEINKFPNMDNDMFDKVCERIIRNEPMFPSISHFYKYYKQIIEDLF